MNWDMKNKLNYFQAGWNEAEVTSGSSWATWQ
jgi:hypothetical protein